MQINFRNSGEIFQTKLKEIFLSFEIYFHNLSMKKFNEKTAF